MKNLDGQEELNSQQGQGQGVDDEVDAISLFNEITQDSNDSGDSVDELDQEQDTEAKEQPDDKGADAGEGQAATDDPWSSAPEALRNEYLTLKQQHQQLEANHRANAGRVSALTKKLNEVTAGLKANEQANGANANSANGLPTADDLKGKSFAEVEEEFPEIAAFVRNQVDAATNAFKQQLTPLEEMRQQQAEAQQQAELRNQFDALASVHPDYQQIAVDPKFHQWVASQPSTVQAMAQSEFADDNIVLLNLYKGSRPAPSAPAAKPKTKPSLADHAEIPRKGAGKAAADTDDVDPVALFNQITSN
ncbi:hypothetical protein K5M76_09555 [Shewanella xiamenensis]|uniref:hypothetical protein n=1 Tax=Shewanella xiamenensis TaxID=332186 RepID=UPI00217CF7D6|nr:hypothetical protein [Shewanella xiamenensis]MCT8857546.1 hypothetical protein [Shewanella xiamenensis]UWG66435.1 hypothetical protein K5M76_09555 [Shewanella xiamenensis]